MTKSVKKKENQIKAKSVLPSEITHLTPKSRKMVDIYLQGKTVTEACKWVGQKQKTITPLQRKYMKMRMQEMEEARKRVAHTIARMMGKVVAQQIKKGVVEKTVTKQKGKPDIVTIKRKQLSVTDWVNILKVGGLFHPTVTVTHNYNDPKGNPKLLTHAKKLIENSINAQK